MLTFEKLFNLSKHQHVTRVVLEKVKGRKCQLHRLITKLEWDVEEGRWLKPGEQLTYLAVVLKDQSTFGNSKLHVYTKLGPLSEEILDWGDYGREWFMLEPRD